MAKVAEYFDEDYTLPRFDPGPLSDICLQYVSMKIRAFNENNPNDIYKLGNVIWPTEICNRFLEIHRERSKLDDKIAALFSETGHTRFTTVDVKDSDITDVGSKMFLTHYLKTLKLVNCENLTCETYYNIIHYAKYMKHLCIGGPTPIFPSSDTLDKKRLTKRDVENFRIQWLVISNQETFDFKHHTYMLRHLTRLELSGMKLQLPKKIKLPRLVFMSLHNTWFLDENIDFICNLVNLQHLDLSQHFRKKYGTYTDPDEKLDKIVSSLPRLKSLDISGTNLAGGASCDVKTYCSIPGLTSRLDKPLEFLGLFRTANFACGRYDIPALNISGNKNEDQIITACIVYMDRLEVLSKAMVHLLNIFPCGETKQPHKALMIVLQAMDTYLDDKRIQITGSSALKFIVTNKVYENISEKLRRHIISTLLNCMEIYIEFAIIMKNGYYTIDSFDIPKDITFEFKRFIVVLIKTVTRNRRVPTVEGIAVRILNSLASQVTNSQKIIMGECGVITTMLSLTTNRIKRSLCDEVLEVAWSTLWNVTDLTPSNSERFLNESGLLHFMGCLKCFSGETILLKNIMGLLGNVVEVKEFRPAFMIDNLVLKITEMLGPESAVIEVSFNAAGVIAYLASDGVEAWTIEEPTRDVALKKIVESINGWNLESKQSINYGHLQPLVYLLSLSQTPECQHWAAWALANFTNVYPEIYCQKVERQIGEIFLKNLVNDPTTDDSVKKLIRIVLANLIKERRHDEKYESLFICTD